MGQVESHRARVKCKAPPDALPITPDTESSAASATPFGHDIALRQFESDFQGRETSLRAMTCIMMTCTAPTCTCDEAKVGAPESTLAFIPCDQKLSTSRQSLF
jgi:hypothetical protein